MKVFVQLIHFCLLKLQITPKTTDLDPTKLFFLAWISFIFAHQIVGSKERRRSHYLQGRQYVFGHTETDMLEGV